MGFEEISQKWRIKWKRTWNMKWRLGVYSADIGVIWKLYRVQGSFPKHGVSNPKPKMEMMFELELRP